MQKSDLYRRGAKDDLQVEDKEEKRKEIEKQIEEFLKNGGEINEVDEL